MSTERFLTSQDAPPHGPLSGKAQEGWDGLCESVEAPA
jgi:hypothetical protein